MTARPAALLLLYLFYPLFAAAPASGQDAPDAARTFERRVASIAARETPLERVEAVVKELEAIGLEPQRREFTGPRRAGVNVLAEVPAAEVPPAGGPAPAKVLMLGAHADRVVAGRGAVDNAGGCAVVLALMERFKQKPLRNHRVVGLWFDQEEQGLLGSRAFADAAAGEDAAAGATAGLPDAFVNVDVFAYGDTLWVCRPTDADAPLAAPFEGVLKPDGSVFGAVVGETYPPSDHRSFAAVRAAADEGSPAESMRIISLSLLPKEQISETVEFLEGMAAGARPARAGLPAILALIHTANDTPAAVRPEEAVAGIDAVEAALRGYDELVGVE